MRFVVRVSASDILFVTLENIGGNAPVNSSTGATKVPLEILIFTCGPVRLNEWTFQSREPADTARDSAETPNAHQATFTSIPLVEDDEHVIRSTAQGG
ncbi:hypothetical protein CFP71_21410 [Amycolatopsis thailandensis]|uniref:Uncharacterized protein n=1 Tax=Amycolatopsis thailandensis TaxID=589330 RepID=A0A229S495_9PSEU|nr:hypothetical protein CFP71_21410 [Amycolatopsis thailandensis]